MGREMNATIRIVYIDTPVDVCLSRPTKMPVEKLIAHSKHIDIPTKDECDILEIIKHNV